jgi:hypothetical protein
VLGREGGWNDDMLERAESVRSSVVPETSVRTLETVRMLLSAERRGESQTMPTRATITRFERIDGPESLQGKRYSLEWERLFDRLCHPVIETNKLDLPLWAPTIWPGDNRREGTNPIEVYALVLDLDHGATLSGGVGAIQDGPMACLHTSFQHQRDVRIKDPRTKETTIIREDRFRLVFPLSTPVAAARYGVVWRSAERWMREAHGLVIDGQVKNAGRCWFVPAHAPGCGFEAHCNYGDFLDPWQLVERWPTIREAVSLPPPRKTQPGREASKLKRASAYLARMPESVSGQNGHAALWNAAFVLVKGFQLDPEDARVLLMREFNPRCQPEWSEKEIAHKVRHASTARETGGLIRDRDRKVR